MFDEFSLEVFIIKIKVKGYLENITKKEKSIIDEFGIKNKNNISYNQNNIIHKLKIFDNKIDLVRENKEFINKFFFEKNKNTKSEYYIKEYSTSIDVNIKTKELIINYNRIEIRYEIEETNEEYHYLIEMSEKI